MVRPQPSDDAARTVAEGGEECMVAVARTEDFSVEVAWVANGEFDVGSYHDESEEKSVPPEAEEEEESAQPGVEEEESAQPKAEVERQQPAVAVAEEGKHPSKSFVKIRSPGFGGYQRKRQTNKIKKETKKLQDEIETLREEMGLFRVAKEMEEMKDMLKLEKEEQLAKGGARGEKSSKDKLGLEKDDSEKEQLPREEARDDGFSSNASPARRGSKSDSKREALPMPKIFQKMQSRPEPTESPVADITADCAMSRVSGLTKQPKKSPLLMSKIFRRTTQSRPVPTEVPVADIITEQPHATSKVSDSTEQPSNKSLAERVRMPKAFQQTHSKPVPTEKSQSNITAEQPHAASKASVTTEQSSNKSPAAAGQLPTKQVPMPKILPRSQSQPVPAEKPKANLSTEQSHATAKVSDDAEQSPNESPENQLPTKQVPKPNMSRRLQSRRVPAEKLATNVATIQLQMARSKKQPGRRKPAAGLSIEQPIVKHVLKATKPAAKNRAEQPTEASAVGTFKKQSHPNQVAIDSTVTQPTAKTTPKIPAKQQSVRPVRRHSKLTQASTQSREQSDRNRPPRLNLSLSSSKPRQKKGNPNNSEQEASPPEDAPQSKLVSKPQDQTKRTMGMFGKKSVNNTENSKNVKSAACAKKSKQSKLQVSMKKTSKRRLMKGSMNQMMRTSMKQASEIDQLKEEQSYVSMMSMEDYQYDLRSAC